MNCAYILNQKEALIKTNEAINNKYSNRFSNTVSSEYDIYIDLIYESIYKSAELGLYSCVVYVPNDCLSDVLFDICDKDFGYEYNSQFSLLNIFWDKAFKD